ncbi:MAG: hypothetical protein WBX25_05000 [Rhodomicrobium sp.]
MKQTAASGGLAGLCIAPSAVANVLPHILALSNHGAIDSAEATTAIFQGVSVIAMAAMPFGIQNLSAVTLKLACWLLAIVLFGLNLFNALDAATHVREAATGLNRGTIAKAAALNSRLAELRKSRSQVPPFTFTSLPQASAAQRAADEATRAKDLECGKIGPNCRKRMDEAAAEAGRLSEVLANRSLTERAETLDSGIAVFEKQLADLGPVPVHADATASKAARLIGAFISVGSHADEEIAEWRPIAFAFGIELLALIGPIGMVAAMRGGAVSEKQQPAISEKEPVKVDTGALQTPAVEIAGLTVPAPTPAKPKKAKQIKKAALAGLGDVREWHHSRTTVRADSLIRCNECYSAYVEWCKGQGLEAVSLTKFGTLMKGDLNVRYVEKSRRGYYAGIALKGAGLKVVASS